MPKKVTYSIKKLGYHEYGVYRNGHLIKNYEYQADAERFVKSARDERKRILKLEKAYKKQAQKTGKNKRLPKSRVRKIFGG